MRVAGEEAKLGHVWPHMLRHSCGYYLADKGTDLRTVQDYLGHRDPKQTARFASLAASSPARCTSPSALKPSHGSCPIVERTRTCTMRNMTTASMPG